MASTRVVPYILPRDISLKFGVARRVFYKERDTSVKELVNEFYSDTIMLDPARAFTFDFAVLPDGMLTFGGDDNDKSKRTKDGNSTGHGKGYTRLISVSPPHSVHMPVMRIFPEVVAIAGKERLISASEKSRKVAQLSSRGWLKTASDLQVDLQVDKEIDCSESDYDADDERSICGEYSFSPLGAAYDADDEDDQASGDDTDREGAELFDDYEDYSTVDEGYTSDATKN
ncbi:hypothetical protein BG006_007346 [Podila minutissima]|uniref:Uncharacterized protein n=1 Tax=Podila minutissima TaxID=64525 RepID=A0A9P5SJZ5_9FUNG|nr:hypothetical protein BG006_007346 [Podila minutissima]